MPTKQRKDYRFSEMTIQQLGKLAAEWKTTPTRVLEILVDRAYADLIKERQRTFQLTERETQFFSAGFDLDETDKEIEGYVEGFIYGAIRSRWENLPSTDESKIYDAWKASVQYRELVQRTE